ncbi:uncharacterized protein KD926_011562 [Aspergillus affinis]|uniref:uncharacterized protein n=1 Tax=Aspergillus affinis TaxID=1070780 RepID=UPI0022FE4FEF|nr:uncharacterized protein KD926_011562 [Aspergillus affinis]KAI9037859.1 hypothetical protein KD926_011562 [Aspergillus affinis]
MGLFNFFKSSSTQQQEQQPQQTTWDSNTLAMQQPSCPAAPSTEGVVTEQPNSEQNMKLRGGGEGGDICCGVCAGLCCFECCEECC